MNSGGELVIFKGCMKLINSNSVLEIAHIKRKILFIRNNR